MNRDTIQQLAGTIERLESRRKGDSQTLTRIERNTGILHRLFSKKALTPALPRPAVTSVTSAQSSSGEPKKTYTLATALPQKRFDKAEKSKQVTAIATTVQRDNSGKFSKSEQALRDAKVDRDKVGIADAVWLRKGKGIFANGRGSAEEAAGKAVGGPIYESARELRDMAGELGEKIRDEKSIAGKVFKALGSRFGRKKDPTTMAVEKTEKAEQRRHRELIQVVKGQSTTVKGGGDSIIGDAIGSALGGSIGRLLAPLAGLAMPITALVAAIAGFLGVLAIFKQNRDTLPLPPQNAINPIAPSDVEKARWKDGLFNSAISSASEKHGVDRSLIKGVIETESGFNTKAKSSAGAQGLMQLMPGTAKALKVSDANDPRQNIAGGTAHLGRLLKKYGNEPKALQAYNWGEANMDAYLKTGKGAKGQSMPEETRQYAAKVLRNKGIFAQVQGEQASAAQATNAPTATQAAIALSEPTIPTSTLQPSTTNAPVASARAIAQPKPLAQPTPLKAPAPAPVQAKVTEMDRLVAAVQQGNQQAREPQQQVAALNVPTEFNDSLLTLIVYDRV